MVSLRQDERSPSERLHFYSSIITLVYVEKMAEKKIPETGCSRCWPLFGWRRNLLARVRNWGATAGVYAIGGYADESNYHLLFLFGACAKRKCDFRSAKLSNLVVTVLDSQSRPLVFLRQFDSPRSNTPLHCRKATGNDNFERTTSRSISQTR